MVACYKCSCTSDIEITIKDGHLYSLLYAQWPSCNVILMQSFPGKTGPEAFSVRIISEVLDLVTEIEVHGEEITISDFVPITN